MKAINYYFGGSIVLVGIFFILLYSCFSDRGLVNVLSLKKELAEIEADKRNLTAENEQLKEYMYLLRNNKRFIENIAREELGLVRIGEIVYFFKNN
jgi:cell division protein FtsB